MFEEVGGGGGGAERRIYFLGSLRFVVVKRGEVGWNACALDTLGKWVLDSCAAY